MFQIQDMDLDQTSRSTDQIQSDAQQKNNDSDKLRTLEDIAASEDNQQNLKQRLLIKPNPSGRAAALDYLPRLSPLGNHSLAQTAVILGSSLKNESRKILRAKVPTVKPEIAPELVQSEVRQKPFLATPLPTISSASTSKSDHNKKTARAVDPTQPANERVQKLPRFEKEVLSRIQSANTDRKQSLDAYVEYALKHPESKEFVYIKERASRQEPQYNPYDMNIVNYEDVDRNAYYTLSPSVSSTTDFVFQTISLGCNSLFSWFGGVRDA